MASLVFWQGRWSSQHKGDVINRLHHLDRCDIVHYFHFQKSLLFSFEIQLLTIYYSYVMDVILLYNLHQTSHYLQDFI
jgi:hypothetical protein